MRDDAAGLGLELSIRSVQRVLRGEVRPLGVVSGAEASVVARGRAGRRVGVEGPVLELGNGESAAVADILRRAARAGYLEVEDLRFESRPGKISITARVYAPEEEYD